MKKLLALVLALVMSMSLVTISNAAFKDADEISYKEAVDVMASVGVLEGYNNEFSPKDELTRAQAAKIITYLDLGKDIAEALPELSIFKDVPANHWASKYIAYLYQAGIVAGVGDGNFNPDGKVTGYEFGKMLLVVLGYKADVEGLTGTTWQINVAKLVKSNDIAKGYKTNMLLTLTREAAAQMAFNTIKAAPVDHYTGSNTVVNVGGVEIKTDAGTPVKKDANNDGLVTTNVDNFYVDKYDSKLVYTAAQANDFGAPAHKWTYKGKSVDTYVDTAAVIYTGLKENKTSVKNIVADELTAAGAVLNTSKAFLNPTTNTTYTVVATVTNASNNTTTGATIANVTDLVALTGNGKQVQIFISSSSQMITAIVVTEYTVGKVTDVKETSKTSDGAVYTTYTVAPIAANDVDDTGTAVSGRIYTKKASDSDTNTASVYTDIAKKDIVTYVKANGKLYIYPTTVVTGIQGSKSGDTLNIAGTSYTVGSAVVDKTTKVTNAEFVNNDKAANYYLDQFGFAVATTAVETETNYAYVENAGISGTLNLNVVAKLVFADGSTQEVTISKVGSDDASKYISDNSYTTASTPGIKDNVVKYSVADDKTYEVTIESTLATVNTSNSVSSGTDFITKNVVWASGSAFTNNATKFVVKTLNSSGKAVYTAYTGYAEVPTISAVGGAANIKYAFVKTSATDSAIELMFIDATATNAKTVDNTEASTYVYFIDTDVTVNGVGSKATYTFKAIKDSELTDVTVSKSVYDASISTGLYKVQSVDKDGVITGWASPDWTSYTTGISDAKNGVLNLNGAKWVYDKSETVVFIDTDKSVSTGTADGIAAATTAAVYVIPDTKTTATNDFITLYVVLKDEA